MGSEGTGESRIDLGRAAFALMLTMLYLAASTATVAPGLELRRDIFCGLALMWAGYHWFRVCVPPRPAAKWAFDPTRWRWWLTVAVGMTPLPGLCSIATHAVPYPVKPPDLLGCVWFALTGFAWYRVLLPR